MNLTFSNLKLPAILGTGVVSPVIVLELVNRNGFKEGFPSLLFFIIWLLSVGLIFTVKSICHAVQYCARKAAIIRETGALLALSLVLAFLLFNILQDQMPCFLGMQFCD